MITVKKVSDDQFILEEKVESNDGSTTTMTSPMMNLNGLIGYMNNTITGLTTRRTALQQQIINVNNNITNLQDIIIEIQKETEKPEVEDDAPSESK